MLFFWGKYFLKCFGVFFLVFNVFVFVLRLEFERLGLVRLKIILKKGNEGK